MHARTLESALEAVSVNMGITFTPEVPLTQLRNSENIRYLSILTDDTHYEFNLVYRKGAYIDPSLENFSRIFMENYQKVMPAAQNLYINTKWKIVPLQLHTHCREHRELVYMEHTSGPRCLDLYLPEHLNRPAPVILNVSGGRLVFRTQKHGTHRKYCRCRTFARLRIRQHGLRQQPSGEIPLPDP